MSSIKHLQNGYFESRVRFTKVEASYSKEGVREYANLFIQFFTVLFGLAINVAYKGIIYCLNKNSFKAWVARNLRNAPQLDAPNLIAQVNLPLRFPILKAEIQQLDKIPYYIAELCEQPPSVESYRQLKAWRKSRDVLFVMSKLAKKIKVKVPSIENLNSITEWIEKAQEFSPWFKRHEAKLVKIDKLNLSNTQIKYLPEEFAKLIDLREIDLAGNLLKKLPSVVTKLINLQTLNLEQNQLDQLPHEILKLVNLEILDIRKNQFTEVPVEIYELVNLQELYLSSNKIRVLSPEIGKLVNLKVLWASFNELVELPTEIGKLINLVKLELGKNLLQKLPKEIGNLQNLQGLLLTCNLLQKLPREIGNLVNLTELLISQNSLQELPHEILALSKLKKLLINSNPDLHISKAMQHKLKHKIHWFHYAND